MYVAVSTQVSSHTKHFNVVRMDLESYHPSRANLVAGVERLVNKLNPCHYNIHVCVFILGFGGCGVCFPVISQ